MNVQFKAITMEKRLERGGGHQKITETMCAVRSSLNSKRNNPKKDGERKNNSMEESETGKKTHSHIGNPVVPDIYSYF